MIQKKEVKKQDEEVLVIPDSDALNEYLDNSGIDTSLSELVKIRASQLNNCEYCTDIHIYQAKTKGRSNLQLLGLSIWPDIPFYSDKERAALAWTEVLTRLSEKNIKEEFYKEVSSYLSTIEMEVISNTILSINHWKKNSEESKYRFI